MPPLKRPKVYQSAVLLVFISIMLKDKHRSHDSASPDDKRGPFIVQNLLINLLGSNLKLKIWYNSDRNDILLFF